MRLSTLLSLAAFAALGVPAAGLSQTLPARPVPLGEPVQGGTWKDGELILGRTTLAGARRMLVSGAPRAASDSANPRRLPDAWAWEVGGVTLRPRWRFDPGKGFYELYFDDNERLIFAVDRTPRPDVSRLDLLARYPRALRVQQSDSFDQFQVDVQPCVTLTALIDRKRDHVLQFGYAWTCHTRSLAGTVEPQEPDGR
jgi:hypothetical protein